MRIVRQDATLVLRPSRRQSKERWFALTLSVYNAGSQTGFETWGAILLRPERLHMPGSGTKPVRLRFTSATAAVHARQSPPAHVPVLDAGVASQRAGRLRSGVGTLQHPGERGGTDGHPHRDGPAGLGRSAQGRPHEGSHPSASVWRTKGGCRLGALPGVARVGLHLRASHSSGRWPLGCLTARLPTCSTRVARV